MQSILDFFYNTHINHYFLSDVTWNLFLALAPCALTFLTYRVLKGKKWRSLPFFERLLFIPLFLLWLFFLPNTVYLFAMVRHLLDYCDPDTVFRICRDKVWVPLFFFSFALVGVPTFVYSVERMNRVFKNLFGRLAGIFFPVIIIPVTTLGLLIGLLRRFNSWDIIRYPLFTLKDTLYYFAKPEALLNLLVYMIGLYAIYYGGLWFCKIVNR